MLTSTIILPPAPGHQPSHAVVSILFEHRTHTAKQCLAVMHSACTLHASVKQHLHGSASALHKEVTVSAGLLHSSLHILLSNEQRCCGCTHQLCFAAEQQQISYLVACNMQFYCITVPCSEMPCKGCLGDVADHLQPAGKCLEVHN